MPPSSATDSNGQPEPADPNPKRTGGDLQRCRIAGVSVRPAALLAGLAVCLAVLAVAAPIAAWRLRADFANQGQARPARPATIHAASVSAPPALGRLSAGGLHRVRHLQSQNFVHRRPQPRYAQARQRRESAKWRRRHRSLILPDQQYWAAALFTGGEAEGIDLSELTYSDMSVGLAESSGSIWPDPVTSSEMQYRGSVGGSEGGLAGIATGSLTVSGASIVDTSKVTVNAGGTVQLFSTPDWSLSAKFGGEFAPDTSAPTMDAGGTLQLFSASTWSFVAKFDDTFAAQSQLYAGYGALHHTW